MPLAWNASIGKVTVLSAPGFEAGTVIADFQQHPFHLIKGSVATSTGGEDLRLTTYEAMMAGEDVHDAIVLIRQGKGPGCPDMKDFMDHGARAILSDYAMNAAIAPDGLQWNNAFTERHNWHTVQGDRPFIGFAITPRMGQALRDALAIGEIKLHVVSDGRLYEDQVDLVTALVPGESSEEYWMLAHLYEPLSNDNSAGVASVIETALAIMAKGTPHYSLRLIFGLEYYGFASYAALRGDKILSAEVVGACDFDAMVIRDEWALHLNGASPCVPFFGNFILRMMYEDLKDSNEFHQMFSHNAFGSMYDDDSFLGDSTIGIPTVWPIRRCKTALWHNSGQTMDYIHPEAFKRATAFNAAFADAIVSPRPELMKRLPALIATLLDEEKQRMVGSQREHMKRRIEILRQDLMNFKRPFHDADLESAIAILDEADKAADKLPDVREDSKILTEAENFHPKRLKTGFPFDVALAPQSERRWLLGSVLYSPLAAILSNMDGKRSLAECIRRTEHETCKLISEDVLEACLKDLQYLAQYGYITMDADTP